MYSHLLQKSEFLLQNYSIAPLREQDITSIKEWRNAQLDVLRQKRQLSDQDQIRYYNDIVKPTFIDPSPTQMLFSFLLDNECIGYGGITNIDWESERTELSFLLDNTRVPSSATYTKEFSIFISLIKQLVFDTLNLNRIFTETYDVRPLHVSILEKNGFILEGRARKHIKINGKFVDSLIHGYLKEQYVNSK
jgi:RimJ/RimL family protein N-acetyltransferase